MALRVALIGFGTIGQRLARGLLAHPETIELTGVLVHELAPAQAAARGGLQAVRARLTDDRAAWLATRPELVVECAGHAAVDAHAEAGHLLLRLDNQPDPDNPRTSLVTAHSILCAVLNRRAALVL